MNAPGLRLIALPLALSALLFAGCIQASENAGGPASSPSAAVTGTASPSPSAESTGEPLLSDEELLRSPAIKGGKRNTVNATTRADGKLRIRTNLQFNRLSGDTINPINEAYASASCTDCQAIAVAVQINVYERGAPVIAPRNTAQAVNENCTRCTTIARAVQYVMPVDDLDNIPREVQDLVREINKEARYFERLNDAEKVDPAEVEARLQGILQRFAMLDQFLTQAVDRADSGDAATASPAGSPSPAVSATPSPVGSASPSLTSTIPASASPAGTPTP